jgi:hypothetical protein
MCLQAIMLDSSEPGRMFAAISAAGAFRSDDEGQPGIPACARTRGGRNWTHPYKYGLVARLPHRHRAGYRTRWLSMISP